MIEELREAAKALYNMTIGDSEVIVRAPSAEKRDAITAAGERLRVAIAAPVVPEGFQLVPIEPTEDMVVNGFESWPDRYFSKPEDWAAFEAMTGCQQAAHKARLCYAAMIEAAPTAPAQPCGCGVNCLDKGATEVCRYIAQSAQPCGEDAANGAMGKREAFEVWWNANQTWPVAAKNLAFLAWNTRASLAAEKVAAQELVDEEGDDLDDEYPETPTSRQAARVGVLEFHLRRIAMSYEAGDKARVLLPTVIEGVREFLLENGWKRDAVKLFAAPQPAQSPDGRTIDKAMVKRLAVQHGLLPVQTQVALTDEQRDNFDVRIKSAAEKHALDRTADGGWIFENHNLFNFAYAVTVAHPASGGES